MSKPKCDLLNCDGNVFSLVGAACRSLERAGQRDKAKELKSKLFSCGSYDQALALIMEYVDVQSPEPEDDDDDFSDDDDRYRASDDDDDDNDTGTIDDTLVACDECSAGEGEPCEPTCRFSGC